MNSNIAVENTRPGAKNRTYLLVPKECLANDTLSYSDDQDRAFVLVEHERGLRADLTREQVASLAEAIPGPVLDWARALPSVEP